LKKPETGDLANKAIRTPVETSKERERRAELKRLIGTSCKTITAKRKVKKKGKTCELGCAKNKQKVARTGSGHVHTQDPAHRAEMTEPISRVGDGKLGSLHVVSRLWRRTL